MLGWHCPAGLGLGTAKWAADPPRSIPILLPKPFPQVTVILQGPGQLDLGSVTKADVSPCRQRERRATGGTLRSLETTTAS